MIRRSIRVYAYTREPCLQLAVQNVSLSASGGLDPCLVASFVSRECMVHERLSVVRSSGLCIVIFMAQRALHIERFMRGGMLFQRRSCSWTPAFRRPKFKPLDHQRSGETILSASKHWRLERSVIAHVRLMTVVCLAQIWTSRSIDLSLG